MNAFYLVTDEKALWPALIVSHRVARLWDTDVHVFYEGNADIPPVVTKHVRVHVHDRILSGRLPLGLPSSSKWPSVVYLRIFAPYYLNAYDRLIYLDADVIPVRRDDRIWHVEAEYGFAAVRDYAVVGRSPLPDIAKHDWLRGIGVKNSRYFNSGVMLIDPIHWNERDIIDELNKYISLYRSNIRMFDQDFLNFVLQEKRTELTPCYNFQFSIWNFGIEEQFAPIFLHASRPEKPWMSFFDSSFQDLDWAVWACFRSMRNEAGLDDPHLISLTQMHSPTDTIVSRVKRNIRKFARRYGVISGRERRLIGEWAMKSEIYDVFFSIAVECGIFADDYNVSDQYSSPKLDFDGRYLRSTLGPKAVDTFLSLANPRLGTAATAASPITSD